MELVGEEEIQGVDISCCNTQIRGLGVEIRFLGQLTVNPAEIDGQAVVDEHPQIVVARKAEDLTTIVGELRVKLVGKMIVVRIALLSEEHPVDGEELLVVKHPHPIRALHELNGPLR